MNPKGIPSNYVQNEQGEWCHPSRVGGVCAAKPKRDTVHALDQSKKTRRVGESGVVLRVTLIRRGKAYLDDDNLAAAFKGLRDAIAESLEIDDADLRVRWFYEQQTGKPYGTIVLFHMP